MELCNDHEGARSDVSSDSSVMIGSFSVYAVCRAGYAFYVLMSSPGRRVPVGPPAALVDRTTIVVHRGTVGTYDSCETWPIHLLRRSETVQCCYHRVLQANTENIDD